MLTDNIIIIQSNVMVKVTFYPYPVGLYITVCKNILLTDIYLNDSNLAKFLPNLTCYKNLGISLPVIGGLLFVDRRYLFNYHITFLVAKWIDIN